MFCATCGTEIPDGTERCPECGAEIPSRIAAPLSAVEAVHTRAVEGGKITRPSIMRAALLLAALVVIVIFGVITAGIMHLTATPPPPPSIVQDDGVSPKLGKPLEGSRLADGPTTVAPQDAQKLEEQAKEADEQNDGFVLPESSEHALTPGDIEGLTAEQLLIARNEIYARHGRKFKMELLQQHFGEMPWYNGTIDPDDFDESQLTSIERQNISTLMNREQELGSPYI